MEAKPRTFEGIPHPMEAAHYLEWIEIIVNGQSCRKFLKPGDKPEALFAYPACPEVYRREPGRGKTAQEIIARSYCNIHGLWRS